MRYPVKPLLWLLPPLWPIAVLLTVIWALTHWVGWLLAHAVVMTALILAAVSDPNVIPAAVVAGGTFVVHLVGFGLWEMGRLKRQYKRDVAAARYWQSVNAAAAASQVTR